MLQAIRRSSWQRSQNRLICILGRFPLIIKFQELPSFKIVISGQREDIIHKRKKSGLEKFVIHVLK